MTTRVLPPATSAGSAGDVRVKRQQCGKRPRSGPYQGLRMNHVPTADRGQKLSEADIDLVGQIHVPVEALYDEDMIVGAALAVIVHRNQVF